MGQSGRGRETAGGGGVKIPSAVSARRCEVAMLQERARAAHSGRRGEQRQTEKRWELLEVGERRERRNRQEITRLDQLERF
eukprot:6174298-Pleurochrysis_carterae.AAC.2